MARSIQMSLVTVLVVHVLLLLLVVGVERVEVDCRGWEVGVCSSALMSVWAISGGVIVIAVISVTVVVIHWQDSSSLFAFNFDFKFEFLNFF